MFITKKLFCKKFFTMKLIALRKFGQFLMFCQDIYVSQAPIHGIADIFHILEMHTCFQRSARAPTDLVDARQKSPAQI